MTEINLIKTIYDMTQRSLGFVQSNVFKETLRQLIHIFGNIYFIDSDNNKTKIHCLTGKQERAIAKLKQENSLVLPYITISENGFVESTKRRKNKVQLVNEVYWDEKEKRAKRILSLPSRAIDIKYQVNVWCKYHEDLDVIRSSILNLFNPDLNIDTKFSNFTKAYITDEIDIAPSTADDNADRVLKKTINITVETYIPSPKFLYTNTGEIKAFKAEIRLKEGVKEETILKPPEYLPEPESEASNGNAPFPILTLSGSLNDVTITSVDTGYGLVWDGMRWTASALAGVGGGVTDHGALTGREDNDHPQYVLSATNQNLSSLVSNIQTSTVSLSSYIAANESSWTQGVTDHGALSGLGDDDHPQYASSSVSAQIQSVSSYASGVSSIVSSHINDGAIHFTSGSLSGVYVLTSTNSNLSSLVSNIETSTINLSSTLQSHIASAVHWELNTLNQYYLNSSGDSANAGFYLSSVSATDISATNYYNLPSSTLLWKQAQDVVLLVKNRTQTAIPIGTPVAVVSAVGDNPVVEPVSSVSSHVPEAYGFANHVAGLAQGTIPADELGYIVVAGIITGGEGNTFDTSMWNAGDSLYVSSNGQLSNDRPPPPYEMHPVGIVLRSHPNVGSMLVMVENAPELNDIVGLNLASSIIDGDVIAYDNASKTFKNVQALNLSGTSRIGTVSATTYLNLPSGTAIWNANQLQGRNVAINPPANGDALVWNTSQSRWEPSSISTGTGSVTNNPGGSNGDIQFKNGSTFSGVDSMNYDSATSKLNVTNLSAVSLTATNFTNAKLDDHIASASVHFTSGSLSSYYAASSWVSANFAPSIHSHTFSALSGLSDVLVVTTPSEGQSLVWSSTKWVPSSVAGGGAPVDLTPYVLSSTNQGLSALVSNIETSTVGLSSTLGAHIGSAVHWDLATLNTNYINASGDSANAGFFFSSISGTLLSLSSAITNSVPLLITATSSVSASLMFFSADSGGNITEAARMNFKGIGNLFFGRRSGTALTTGTYNTGIGQEALSYVTTGNYNTAVGEQASERTTGSSNTSLGYFAGYNQNSGSRNTSIGSEANAFVGSTNDNTAVGYQANYTGAASFNVAVGAEALRGNAIGPGNTAVGYRSLFRSSSGTGNIGLGYQAGYGFSSTAGGVSSTNNIVIGYNSNTPEGILLSNTIVIGSGTNSTASNQTIIGHPSTSSTILRGTVSSTSLISNSISGTNISGAIVSATTVSAGTLHLGGSDGYLINNNGSIIISAVNGTVKFPQGFEVTGALSGSTVSATTYLNLPTSSLSGLADTQITTPSEGQSLVWNGTKWQPSSVAGGGGAGVTDHGALTGLLDDDHPQYASSAVSAQIQSVSAYASGVSSIVSSHLASASVHFTSGSLSAAYVLTSTNSGLSSLVSNIETSTVGLSSTLGSHLASASVHFTSGSLSGAYVLTSTNSGLSSLVANLQASTASISAVVNSESGTLASHIASASVHFTSGSLSGYYAASSWVSANFASSNHSHSFSALSGLSDVNITGVPTSGQNLIYKNSKWEPGYTLYISSTPPSDDIGANGDIYFDYSNTFLSAITISATNYQNLPTSSLSGLSDVRITGTPSEGQSLVWSSTKWVPSSVAGGTGGGATPLGPNYAFQFYKDGSLSSLSGFIWEPEKYNGSITLSGQVKGLNIYGFLYSDSLGAAGSNGLTLYGGASGDGVLRTGSASSVSANAFITPSLSATTISATTYRNLPSSTPTWNANQLSSIPLAFQGVYDAASLTNLDLLVYTNAHGLGTYKWTNVSPTLLGLNAGAVWDANKLQGYNISSTAPTNGKALVYDGAGWVPSSIPTGGGGGATPVGGYVDSAYELQFYYAGGLSGVSGLLYHTNNFGNKLVVSGGVAGIDVYGSIFASYVNVGEKITLYGGGGDDGVLDSGPGASVSANAFITPSLSATTISATNYYNLPSGTAIWNASAIQGVSVTSTAPTTGQTLVYDGTKWAPSSLSSTSIITNEVQSIWIPAVAMYVGSGGATVPSAAYSENTGLILRSIDFDPASEQYAQFTVRMPKSWNEGAITYNVLWEHSVTSTSYGVVWRLDAQAASDGDSISFNFTNGVSVTDTGGTISTLYISPDSGSLTITNAAENDLILFRIARVAADANDSFGSVASLMGVTIKYTINTSTDL